MIKDLLRDPLAPGERSDVCVIGAGAAGITLALELVRLGSTVVLLEAGGLDPQELNQELYRSELTGLPHRGVHFGRFRVLGGTTTKWGGQILELDAQDFEARPGIRGSGWPITKVALAPYYQQALRLEGLHGAIQSDENVWGSVGQEMPHLEELESYFSRWCPEPNFAYLHEKTLKQHPRLTVWLHANALNLLMQDHNARAVRCSTLTGVEAFFFADQFAFCLGAIESSRFFLQPQYGAVPWNRSGLVGKHFQDHIDSNAAVIEPINTRRFHALVDNILFHGFKYHPKFRLSPSVQRNDQTLNVAGTVQFVSSADNVLEQLRTMSKHIRRGRWGSLRADDIVFMTVNSPMFTRMILRYALKHRTYNPPSSELFLRVHCEQEPEAASSITLAEQRDSLGLFRTRLDWQISELELKTIRRFVEASQRSLAEIARIIPSQALMLGNPDFREQCYDSNHHMGGMRMSYSEHNGVVDPQLRLYGTHNVYVCSAAVFPTSGFSNPTHTILALAIRLAKHFISLKN